MWSTVARYIQLTGGSTLQAGGECARIVDILQAIDETAGIANIPGEIIVYTTPPAVAQEIDSLFAAGADRIACDIEIWNEAIFREICPGKSQWTGRQRALDTLLHIAGRHGPNKACSTFVVGLEPAEDFLAGAEYLARNGIVPIPSIWMPHGLPPVPSPVKADLAFFRAIKRGLAEIYDKYQCPPPGDLGFNVCLMSGHMEPPRGDPDAHSRLASPCLDNLTEWPEFGSHRAGIRPAPSTRPFSHPPFSHPPRNFTMNRAPLMDRLGLRGKAKNKHRGSYARLGIELLEERRLLTAYNLLVSTIPSGATLPPEAASWNTARPPISACRAGSIRAITV